VNAGYTARWQIPGYWCSRMLLVESVGGVMAAKAADHGNISILVLAISDPYCARSRSSVVARLWKMVTMAF
jgi:hypothetical protein